MRLKQLLKKTERKMRGNVIISGEVDPLVEFLQSVADLCQAHLIVHFIRGNIGLVPQQTPAEDQLLEGLKRSKGR